MLVPSKVFLVSRKFKVAVVTKNLTQTAATLFSNLEIALSLLWTCSRKSTWMAVTRAVQNEEEVISIMIVALPGHAILTTPSSTWTDSQMISIAFVMI